MEEKKEVTLQEGEYLIPVDGKGNIQRDEAVLTPVSKGHLEPGEFLVAVDDEGELIQGEEGHALFPVEQNVEQKEKRFSTLQRYIRSKLYGLLHAAGGAFMAGLEAIMKRKGMNSAVEMATRKLEEEAHGRFAHNQIEAEKDTIRDEIEMELEMNAETDNESALKAQDVINIHELIITTLHNKIKTRSGILGKELERRYQADPESAVPLAIDLLMKESEGRYTKEELERHQKEILRGLKIAFGTVNEYIEAQTEELTERKKGVLARGIVSLYRESGPDATRDKLITMLADESKLRKEPITVEQLQVKKELIDKLIQVAIGVEEKIEKEWTEAQEKLKDWLRPESTFKPDTVEYTKNEKNFFFYLYATMVEQLHTGFIGYAQLVDELGISTDTEATKEKELVALVYEALDKETVRREESAATGRSARVTGKGSERSRSKRNKKQAEAASLTV